MVVSIVSLIEIHYEAIIRSIVDAQKDSKVGDYYRVQFTWDLNTIYDGLHSYGNSWTQKYFVGLCSQ